MTHLVCLGLLLLPLSAVAQDAPVQAAPWLSIPGTEQPALGTRPAWATEAAAAPSSAAAPWLSPVSAEVAGSSPTVTIQLEREWSWPRLSADLEIVGRVRAGLEDELATLKRERSRLLVKDPRTGDLLVDHQAFLLSAWRRVADRLLALDSIIERYRAFEALQADEPRAGAFLAAYAAYAAQTRLGRDWVFAAGDPAAAKVLDGIIPDLGLKAGSFTSLREAVLGSRGETLAEAKAYATPGSQAAGSDFRMEGARGLLKAGPAAAFALAGIKQDTKGGKTARRGSAVPVPNFMPWLGPVTAAGVWTGDEVTLKPKIVRAEPAAPDWSAASLASLSPFSQPWSAVLASTETAPAAQEESTFHRIVRLLVERSTATRPAALVVEDQLISLAGQLQPGDILLFRREHRIEEPGLNGWWTGAALYVGTPEERERLTGSTELDSRINAAASEAYWTSIKTEDGKARRLITASPHGIRVRSIERAAAADSVAALRPRLPKEARANAVLRAFQAIGRPYDGAFDTADAAKLYSAELILWAYAETPLRLEARESDHVGPPNPDDFARTFDSAFGTSHESLDVVRFLDGVESDRRAVRHEAEEFRLTWKRPRWRYQDSATAKTAVESQP